MSSKQQQQDKDYEKVQALIKKYATPTDAESYGEIAKHLALYTMFLLAAPFVPSSLMPFYDIMWGFSLTRTFVLFHEFVHSSFFATKAQNDFWGHVIGGLCWTPLFAWRRNHLIHHSIYGNFDIYDPARTVFLTKAKYDSLPIYFRIPLRIIRDPFFFFPAFPVIKWFIHYRFRKGSLINNIIVSIVLALVYLYGGMYLMKHYILALWWGGIVGFVLFHWQHFVNMSYYVNREEYSREKAALEGSTCLMVPWYLEWATLRIEYHHIHHWSTKVPCYRLKECHEEGERLKLWKDVNYVNGEKAIRSFFHSMWNEKTRRYESFDIYESFFRTFFPKIEG